MRARGEWSRMHWSDRAAIFLKAAELLAGSWREVFNSDAQAYGGSGMGNFGRVTAHSDGSHGFPASAEIVVPPLATVYLEYEGGGWG